MKIRVFPPSGRVVGIVAGRAAAVGSPIGPLDTSSAPRP